MLIIPPAKFRRRRGKARRTQATPPAAALAVVAVNDETFSGVDGECLIVFNTTAEFPLLDVLAADPAKWSARFAGTGYVGSSIELVAYNVLYVTFADGFPMPGANVIGYSNAPSDIADALGRQLGAFEGFPL